MSAVSCDPCGYLKPAQGPLTRQKPPFSVFPVLHQVMESTDLGFFLLLESLAALHGEDTNLRIPNLSILLGSCHPPSPGVGPTLG